MSDDKNPQEQFKEFIKIGVNATNNGLRQAQTIFQSFKEPVSSTLKVVETNSLVAFDTTKSVYLKRKQYAPEIIVGTSVVLGSYSWFRRGRIAGILGAAVGTGLAYSVVYDEFPVDFETLPNTIFGKKE